MTSQTYSTGKIILGNYTRNAHYMYGLGGIANRNSNTRFCISYTTPPVTHNPYSVQPGHMQTTLVDFPTTQLHETNQHSLVIWKVAWKVTWWVTWFFFSLLFFFHQYRSPECTASSHVCKYRSPVCTATVTCMHSHITWLHCPYCHHLQKCLSFTSLGAKIPHIFLYKRLSSSCFSLPHQILGSHHFTHHPKMLFTIPSSLIHWSLLINNSSLRF